MVIVVKLVHLLKTPSEILSRLLERFTLFNDVQPENAFAPIDVTSSGMFIELILVLENAEEPIDLTDCGMVIVVKLVQPKKALSEIFSRLLERFTVFNKLQSWNAFAPIDLTDCGMVIVVKFVHWPKAPSQILVTPSFISTVCTSCC